MKKVTSQEKEKIRDEVMSETQKAFVKAGFTAERMAKEYAIMGFSDPADHSEIAEGGELRFKTFEEQGEKRRAIKKIKEKTTIAESKDGNIIYKTSIVDYELHDKKGTLDTVVGIMGMKAPDKIEMNHQGNIMAAVVNHLSGNKSEAPKQKSKKAKK